MSSLAADALPRRLPVELRRWGNGDVRHHTTLDRLCAFWVLVYGHPDYASHYVEVARQREGGPFRRGPNGGWFERIPKNGQFEWTELERIARRILAIGRREHVYMSVLPRAVPSSKGADVRCARVLWADCDDKQPESLIRLRTFVPRPALVVASGGGRHAYWLLDQPVGPDDARRLGAGIAHALDADRVSDPQRLLRPPGTLNHKTRYGAPRPVELLYVDPAARRISPEQFEQYAERPRPKPVRPPLADDALAQISPEVYVPALTCREAVRQKVRCPLHAGGEERTPSLHIHDHGWYCYGCQIGGGIYQLADLLHGGDGRPRGERFRELQAELASRFLGLDGRPQLPSRADPGAPRVRSDARPTVSPRRSFGRKP